MTVSRQQRRVRLKESVDHVARYGINLDDTPIQQMWSMIGLTRILIDVLDTRTPARASEAAKRAHEFFDLSLKRNPSNHRIECAKGCGFCCHLRVSAMAPEVFHVANFVRKQFAGTLDEVIGQVARRRRQQPRPQLARSATAQVPLRAPRGQCLLGVSRAAFRLSWPDLDLGRNVQARL